MTLFKFSSHLRHLWLAFIGLCVVGSQVILAPVPLLTSSDTFSLFDTSLCWADTLEDVVEVEEGLYRGDQPKNDEYVQLKEMDIHTVINLRHSKNSIASEKQIVEVLGMRFISIPLNPIATPSSESITEILSMLENESNYPVLVHCYRGADRTGLVIACHRVASDGWTADMAYKEMKENGFNRILRNFKHFVYDFSATQEHKGATGDGELAKEIVSSVGDGG